MSWVWPGRRSFSVPLGKVLGWAQELAGFLCEQSEVCRELETQGMRGQQPSAAAVCVPPATQTPSR